MKIFMVPIPWTHDQYENARWYAHTYKDLLIDQNKEDFLQTLERDIEEHIGHKKTIHDEDKFKKIQEAKEIIWQSILS